MRRLFLPLGHSHKSRGLPRAVEVTLASAGLIACGPLLALAAVCVGSTSKGPVLFSQKRMGKDGKTFVLKKFRTMKVGAQRGEHSALPITAKGDARITRVGKILRKSKIDELPELWNILRGDMSFVGPRPEVPGYVDLKDPLWQEVLRVRPGLTDPVTLRLRNEEELLAQAKDRETFYTSTLLPWKLEGYARYLQERTWRSDVAVLAQTLLAVMMPSRTSPPTLSEMESAAQKRVRMRHTDASQS